MLILNKNYINDIRKDPNSINWDFLSYFYILSEYFIIEFQDKVCWYYISLNQKLSEEFIIKFKDKIIWNMISEYQKLSDNFIRENISKLNKKNLLKNKNISEEIKQIIRLLS